MNENRGRAVGGLARAAKMTDVERRESAKRAAEARWSEPPTLNAVSGSADRPLRIGDATIECYVLDDGTRVITQGSMLEALGRSRRVNVKPSDDTSLPPILRSQVLRGHLSDELIADATPIRFNLPNGSRANGYRAEVLPQVCEAWLEARSSRADLPESQLKIARAAEIIVRGLARVGIIALIDEATGYQEVRARDALAKILEAYVADELQPWVKTFDPDWYREVCRLRGVAFDPASVKYPPYFGTLTNNVIYKRLAPGVFDELKAARARDVKKKRGKMHQQLTPEVGHPKLREHIASTTAVMKLSDNWPDFMEKLDRVHPIIDATMPPPLWDDDDGFGL